MCVRKTYGMAQVHLFTEAKSTQCELSFSLEEPNNLQSQDPRLARPAAVPPTATLVASSFYRTIEFNQFRIRIRISGEKKNQAQCCCHKSTVTTSLRIATYTSTVSMYYRSNEHNINESDYNTILYYTITKRTAN